MCVLGAIFVAVSSVFVVMNCRFLSRGSCLGKIIMTN